MKNSALILALLSFSALSAEHESCVEPCDPCDICIDPCDPCREHLFVERCQLFVTGEFLYWTVEEGALEYAIKMNKSNGNPMTFAIGDYQIADYDFCPGFRVALAWYNEPKYWEVSGQYTWLDSSGSDSTNAPDVANRFLVPTWETDAMGYFTRATSKLDLNYQVGDLLVARVFDPNPHLRMRILGGFTAAYIKQDWKVVYEDINDEVDTLENGWRFWGGGFRLGLTADWFWGNQIYFTARSSFATLLGDYENTSKHKSTASNPQNIGNAKYDDHRFAIHGQFMLGPSWQKPYECWSFELFAGYEFNVWMNIHEIIKVPFEDPSMSHQTQHSRGLFGTHGLTARLTIGF